MDMMCLRYCPLDTERACLPGTFDLFFNRTEPSIVVLVSPLVAIMNDQVNLCMIIVQIN